MNILEARKLGHDGWIRSPSITSGTWIRLDEDGIGRAIMRFGDLTYDYWICDLDAIVAEDWEPKPIPKNLLKLKFGKTKLWNICIKLLP